MPIPVVCPGCKASFNVSEKFAGKQGPCPKCKTVIAIPKLDQVKKQEEVKIGGPEDAPGAAAGPAGKSKTGRPNLKPITRTDLKLSPVKIGVIVASIIGLFVAAFFARPIVMSPYPLTGDQLLVSDLKGPYDSALQMAYILRGVGLLLVAMPIAWAGYQVLRDDELEPYRGKSLYIRTAICVLVYLLLWRICRHSGRLHLGLVHVARPRAAVLPDRFRHGLLLLRFRRHLGGNPLSGVRAGDAAPRNDGRLDDALVR
ncbi:MAG: hypothetical protein QM775_25950 [Pirellulales bacterium]